MGGKIIYYVINGYVCALVNFCKCEISFAVENIFGFCHVCHFSWAQSPHATQNIQFHNFKAKPVDHEVPIQTLPKVYHNLNVEILVHNNTHC